MRVHLIRRETLEAYGRLNPLARNALICKYVFGAKQVHLFVCWIGTHAEYDFICSTGRQYSINIF
jgi:hypothetical protein